MQNNTTNYRKSKLDDNHLKSLNKGNKINLSEGNRN